MLRSETRQSDASFGELSRRQKEPLLSALQTYTEASVIGRSVIVCKTRTHVGAEAFDVLAVICDNNEAVVWGITSEKRDMHDS